MGFRLEEKKLKLPVVIAKIDDEDGNIWIWMNQCCSNKMHFCKTLIFFLSAHGLLEFECCVIILVVVYDAYYWKVRFYLIISSSSSSL